MAIIGAGTILQIEQTAGVWTTIAEILNVNLSGISVDVMEVTSLTSAEFKEFAPTYNDAGELSLTLFFSEAGYAIFYNSVIGKKILRYKILFTDGTLFIVTGFVVSLPVSIEGTDVIKLTVTIKLTGVFSKTDGPVIHLTGDQYITVIKNNPIPYVDAGATATDVQDGDLTADIVVVDVDNFDQSVLGVYHYTYNVKDAEDNEAKEVVRTVTVRDFVLATVRLLAFSSIEATTAVANGTVTDVGDAGVSERGICFMSGAGTPTTANTKVIDVGGLGTGSFALTMPALTPGTLYSVRAYAINGYGTSYSAVGQVTTTLAPPVVQTVREESVTATGFVAVGNLVTANGVIQGRGYECKRKINGGTNTGSLGSAIPLGEFSMTINSVLFAGELFEWRAVVTNQIGSGYGTWRQFKAAGGPIPIDLVSVYWNAGFALGKIYVKPVYVNANTTVVPDAENLTHWEVRDSLNVIVPLTSIVIYEEWETLYGYLITPTNPLTAGTYTVKIKQFIHPDTTETIEDTFSLIVT